MSKELFPDKNKGGLRRGFVKTRNVHSMRKAFSLVKKRQKSNMNRIPDLEGRKKRLREIRETSVGNEELINRAVINLKENGIKVYRVSDNEEAIATIKSEIGKEKLVVKSKSNITKEIGLTESLEAAGIEVIETDIGDRIIQLCHGIPWGAPADPALLKTGVDLLPTNAQWTAFALGRMQMPFVAQSVLLGGNVRVGLEDNLYLDKGVFASNAQLVERARRIIELMGATVIGPEKTRERFGLTRRG